MGASIPGTPVANRGRWRLLVAASRRLYTHRLLALALAAVVSMLPALTSGLFGDDLIQRLKQLSAETSRLKCCRSVREGRRVPWRFTSSIRWDQWFHSG